MKGKFIGLLILVLSLSIYSQEELTIYSYDSLSWISKKVLPEFEKQNNCKVKLVKMTNTGAIVARLKLEKRKPKADVVIGLNQVLFEEAKKDNLLEIYKSKNIENIKNKDIIFDKDYYITPYDFGAIAIIYNPEKMETPPTSFKDITKIKDGLIMQDPRTSSTGQDFFLWTVAAFGDNWKDFWKELKPSILNVAPGWSESFTKFEAGEAPMMVSYGTDGAYSYEYYKSTKYKALIPEEGGYLQIEGAGVVKGTRKEQLAKKFIDFMLTEDFQQELPLNQWMFPVIDVKMPESYKYAVQPKKILKMDGKAVKDNMEKWLEEWEEIMY